MIYLVHCLNTMCPPNPSKYRVVVQSNEGGLIEEVMKSLPIILDLFKMRKHDELDRKLKSLWISQLDYYNSDNDECIDVEIKITESHRRRLSMRWVQIGE